MIQPRCTVRGTKWKRARTCVTQAYRPSGDAFRDFTSSLVEQQEKVYDEMLLHVADLRQRIDAPEDRLEEYRNASPDGAEVKG